MGLVVCSTVGCQFGEAFEVLGGGGEEEYFVLARQALEPYALEAEMSFQVCEQYLDPLSVSFWALVVDGFGEDAQLLAERFVG
ncbi:MAG: hypothetical protein AAF848_11725 [Pseudomonadota bacterium]